MKARTIVRFIVVVVAALARASAHAGTPANLILHNGKVWTVEAKQPVAQAIAVSGNRIVKIGEDAEVLALRGANTSMIDLQGRLVLPGFNDAHTHFENAADWYFQVRLIDVDSPAMMMKRLAEVVARTPPGIWITGGDWGDFAANAKAKDGKRGDFASFEPDLAAIDKLTPNHPVLLRRYDRVWFANSRALSLARVAAKTPDPRNGRYGRNATTGALTGMLYGSAGEAMEKLMPRATRAQKLLAARSVEAQLNAVGITSIADIARDEDISQRHVYPTYVERSYSDRMIFEELKRRGQLSLRVYAFLPLDYWDELADAGIRPGSGDALVRYGALKAFGDASGLMFEPLGDATGQHGDWSFRFMGEDRIAAAIAAADKAGYDVGVHIIGDKAIHELVGWYADAAKANGDPRKPRDRRHRLIHAWYPAAADLKRAGELHLIADVTPDHMTMRDPDQLETLLGAERAKSAFAWRTMVDDGLRLNLVSDLPGPFNQASLATYDPLLNLYTAVTRREAAHAGGQPGKQTKAFHPEQAISIEEAIAAYTINPAYSSHEEDIKGSLAAGKLADLVVLSDDILSGPPGTLLKARVDYTIFDGKVVYTRP